MKQAWSKRIMPQMTETLGARIKYARKLRGLTQAQLGAKCGVSGAAAQQWEKDKTEPEDIDRLHDIATALDVPYEWLTTGKGQEPMPIASQRVVPFGPGDGEPPSGVPLNRKDLRDLLEPLIAVVYGEASPSDFVDALYLVYDAHAKAEAEGRPFDLEMATNIIELKFRQRQ